MSSRAPLFVCSSFAHVKSLSSLWPRSLMDCLCPAVISADTEVVEVFREDQRLDMGIFPQQVVCSRHPPWHYILVCLITLILTLVCELSAPSLSIPRWSSVCSSHTLGWRVSPPPHPPVCPSWRVCLQPPQHSRPVSCQLPWNSVHVQGEKGPETASPTAWMFGSFLEAGELGCQSGSRYSTVAIGIRRICHSFISWRQWLRVAFCPPATGKWQKKPSHVPALSDALLQGDCNKIRNWNNNYWSYMWSILHQLPDRTVIFWGCSSGPFLWFEMSETCCFCRQARAFTALLFR